MTGTFNQARRMHAHGIKRDFGRGVGRGAARSHAHGFTMIEVLVALAVTAVMLAGVATMINSSLEDTRGQQAALYQQQVGAAAKQLIETNVSALTLAAPTIVPFSGGGYQLASFLPAGMRSTNAYGQTPCLLVTKQSDGTLSGLLVTEGGTTIKDSELGYIAANSGQGGGSIPATNNTNGSAIGAYGAWTAPKPTGACTKLTGVGHLASQVYSGTTATQNSDYLYRVSVPGNPKANTMQVPIVLGPTPQADYQTCNALGAIGTDALGNVVNCTATVNGTLWVPQPAFRWRGALANEDAIFSASNKPAVANDMMMSQATNRAYVYDGTTWQALAVDKNGDLQLGNTHTIGDPCPTPDSTSATTLVSTDTHGIVVSCQKTANNTYKWQDQSQITPGQPVNGCVMIMQSPGAGDYPDCDGAPGSNYQAAPFVFNKTNGTYSYPKTISVTLDKPGAVVVVSWAHMNDGLCPTPAGSRAQMSQSVDVYPQNSNNSLAHTESQTPTLTDDSGGINNSLTQALPVGTYSVVVTTNWATYNNLSTPWTSSYCGENSTFIANTPVAAGWTVNTYY
ncbi:shufflon system plasmid conjugative transfer pilus tip adhesin PilV [Paraburkholderia flava]|uniref:shufflon system plasmid conjugative transfer pilus tip adhesin PilV n=1 Tax=Paraburkholderia flava TaxID=2547393 RepID=UPI001F0E4203|nr:shufflon system plasmid conjugative transfer pilus tip adhesin PilV [Paraburkholderia flava]